MLIPIRRESTLESMKTEEPFKSVKSFKTESGPFKSSMKSEFESYKSDTFKSLKSDPFKSARSDFESLKSDAFKSDPFKYEKSNALESFKSAKSNALESFKSDPFNNPSALQLFESNNKRWNRDEFDNFLIPALTNRSLLKDRIGDFKSLLSQKDHPIQIETFASESDRYVLTLNVKQFKPEELQVKITDQMISITAKHEDKKDESNYSCQEFSRKHTLPAGIKGEDIKCDLSSDGVLTVTAPKVVKQPLHSSERNIPIQHIGLSAIKV